MKLFRKFKYRFRRFIISFISILSIVCMSVIPVSADVLPISDTAIEPTVSPYYIDDGHTIKGSGGTFIPGTTFDTNLTVPYDFPFGFVLDIVPNGYDNLMSTKSGVFHLRFSFVTNIYFTDPSTPYVIFGKIDDTVGIKTNVVDSQYVGYSSSVERYDGSGDNSRFLFSADIYIDSNVVPYTEFFNIVFTIERDRSPVTRDWIILFKEFNCEILTGADVPKYSAPNTEAKDKLDDVEGTLNHSFDSFGSGIDDLFNVDIMDELAAGITFWGTTLESFFNLDFVRPIFTLSLACGIFALLFGLFGTLVSRSNARQSQSKSNKSKGG